MYAWQCFSSDTSTGDIGEDLKLVAEMVAKQASGGCTFFRPYFYRGHICCEGFLERPQQTPEPNPPLALEGGS